MSERPDSIYDVKLDHLTRQVDEIHHALMGNGQPGILRDVDRLKQAAESRQDWERKVGGAVIGSIITALGSAAVAVWGLVQHKP